MVVTRRTPVVPPPPLARSHSSQGAQRPPRTTHAKDTANVSNHSGPNVAAVVAADSSASSQDHRNGLDNSPRKKSKKSRRHNKNKYQKTNFQAFLDFLTKLLLLAFTIYTFSVCPQDTHLQSPICRGLSEYRRTILDPYIIPPIQAMFAHPSVAPHIERVKPYFQRTVEITAPVLARTQQQWNLHVVPQWEKHIVPEWNNRVVPQWNKYVVPQWDKHVAPRVQLGLSKVEPYRQLAIREYEQRIAPRTQVAVYNLQRWQRQAGPYILLAVSKTKDGYNAAKPYAVPLARKFGYGLRQSALFLQEQRQKFVDPHVAKIWDKVKELSRGEQLVREAPSDHESSSSEIFTFMETVTYDTPPSFTPSLTSAHHVTPIVEETVSEDVSPSLSLFETPEAKPLSTSAEPTFTSASAQVTALSTLLDTPAATVDSSFSTESSRATPSPESESPVSSNSVPLEDPNAVSPSFLATATATSLSSTPSPADEPSEVTASATPSRVAIPAASATVPPANTPSDEEIDFDAFYAELGLDEPLKTAGGSGGEIHDTPNQPTETEEERAERLRLKAEETARKRADVEARQAKWETELEAQKERGMSRLQSRLGDLRTAAAEELVSSVEVRHSIEELVSEAEKYLKGAEIYLKNLKGENRKSDEKLALWDRVADRVNDKFTERLLATEAVVNAWYKVVLDKELEEVATVVAEVRDIAEKGQLDLGLDYAWLEDVTYDDWQRYHALIGTSERFTQEAASIQNGTHPELAVTNPMGPIIGDLESEVQDIVIGFETRLRRIKRDGERAFNNHSNGVAQKEDEKGSTVEPEVEAEPAFSILPVPDAGVREEQAFVPPVVIGRTRQEVLEALGKVEPIDESVHPARGSNVDPEEAVSRLAREVERGAEILHAEL